MQARTHRREPEEPSVELNEARPVADGDDSRFRQPLEQEVIERRLGALIERARRLVEEQPLRFLQERAGDGEPLLLAA